MVRQRIRFVYVNCTLATIGVAVLVLGRTTPEVVGLPNARDDAPTDGDGIRRQLTIGEDWTMQELVDAVQPKGKTHERKNFFSQIRARQQGNVAWVSYWNKAEIRRESGLRTVVWLESAVMVNEGDRWKIQLLHSTRVEPDKYPQDIEWVPFEANP